MLKLRETVAALFQFVGTVPVGYNDPEMGRLFGQHGISRSAAVDAAGGVGRFLEVFDYGID